ncbi:MAG: hypothetical protein NTV97_17465 [Alphaproteobacteria bacterium]|nr:hypothetical protein [Alphaproteobacteria bacterium]
MLFSIVYGLILVAVTLAGVEILASFLVPPWPQRALRSVEVAASPQAGINSWGMRDRERTIDKPAGVGSRVTIVGDSFVENHATRLSLPIAIEQKLSAKASPIEVVSLGVSATGIASYYYRLKDVGLAMGSDAIVVLFYAGNDFVAANESFDSWNFPPLIDESPGRAILGRIMPRTNWLLINRLRLSELLKGNKGVENEVDTLIRAIRLPPDERVRALSRHVKTYYHPEMPEAQIAEIIGRAGPGFWQQFEERDVDREQLYGWILDLLVGKDIDRFAGLSLTPEDAARIVSREEIVATLSWLKAMNDVARARGVPLLLALAPVALVDPTFADFWKPWPRFFGWNYLSDARHTQLATALAGTDIHVVDLRADLAGIPNTYRKADAHWTEKGLDIVASRLTREIEALAGRKR